MKLKVFKESDIATAFTMKEAIQLAENAYLLEANGAIHTPNRIQIGTGSGTMLYKPAFSAEHNLCCAKMMGAYPANAQKGITTNPGLVILNDASTGLPESLLDAGFLTSFRTAAAAGVATHHFAAEDSETAALFGTGYIAQHQVQAMATVRKLKRIFVFSRDREKAQHFCQHMRRQFGQWEFDCELLANPPRQLLQEAQLLTTATTSSTPVFSAEELGQSFHINAMGSFSAENCEVPTEALAQSEIWVDSMQSCIEGSGELVNLLRSHPSRKGSIISLGQHLSQGTRVPTRCRTIFKSVGLAALDLIFAKEMTARLTEQGKFTVAEL